MKKAIALIATGCLLSSFGMMPVFAEELSLEDQNWQDVFMPPVLSEGEYGQAVFTDNSLYQPMFIAVTDNSGLEEGNFYDTKAKDDPIGEIREQDRLNPGIFSSEVFYTDEDAGTLLVDETVTDGKTSLHYHYLNDETFDYDIHLDDNISLESYGEDSRYYEVSVDKDFYYQSADTTEEANANLAAIAQNFMRTHSNVKDVLIVSDTEIKKSGLIWNGKVSRMLSVENHALIPDGMTKAEFEESVMQKLEDSHLDEEIQQQYAEWEEQINQWKRNVNTYGMTAEELYLSRLENNVPTDYEMWRFVYDEVEKMREVTKEACLYVIPGYEHVQNTNSLQLQTIEGNTTLTSVKPATTAETLSTSSAFVKGNLDDDPNINAADASQILTISANIGAGNTSSVTEEQKNSADVNNDGIINAIDASLILQYSAAKGSGFSGSFTDFLKENA